MRIVPSLVRRMISCFDLEPAIPVNWHSTIMVVVISCFICIIVLLLLNDCRLFFQIEIVLNSARLYCYFVLRLQLRLLFHYAKPSVLVLIFQKDGVTCDCPDSNCRINLSKLSQKISVLNL